MAEQSGKNLNGKKHVGKVMDAHGIRGDIYCLVFSGDANWLDEISTLTLKHRNKEEEFEISRAKIFKKGFIAKLKGFDDRNRAEAYKGAELWIPAELFISKDGESIYLSELLNFTIEDQILGVIGSVEAFSSNGAQDLLIIKNTKKEFEIPFVKDFVLNVDFENQKIKTHLPEGLVDINDVIGTPDDA
ncbi:ribosome maturation factor RimM [bacterium]|nr:ribosome maturation factor RimM [bacterium]